MAVGLLLKASFAAGWIQCIPLRLRRHSDQSDGVGPLAADHLAQRSRRKCEGVSRVQIGVVAISLTGLAGLAGGGAFAFDSGRLENLFSVARADSSRQSASSLSRSPVSPRCAGDRRGSKAAGAQPSCGNPSLSADRDTALRRGRLGGSSARSISQRSRATPAQFTHSPPCLATGSPSLLVPLSSASSR